MYVSFYENQEAAESCYTLLFALGLASGWVLTASFFLVMAINSEEEDRLFEEMLLDSSEPTLYFILGVQKEKFIQHYSSLGLLYTTQSTFVHAHIAEDVSYENTLVSEIYEFPISTLMSNNYYHVPQDERDFTKPLGLSLKLMELNRKKTRCRSFSRLSFEASFSTRRKAGDYPYSLFQRSMEVLQSQRSQVAKAAKENKLPPSDEVSSLRETLLHERWEIFRDNVSLLGARGFVGDFPSFPEAIAAEARLSELGEELGEMRSSERSLPLLMKSIL